MWGSTLMPESWMAMTQGEDAAVPVLVVNRLLSEGTIMPKI